jgi:hypothetical protein
MEECFSDDPDLFRVDQSERLGPPELTSSSGDEEEDQRDRDDFMRQGRDNFIRKFHELFHDIRECSELFEFRESFDKRNKDHPVLQDAPAVRVETLDETEEDQKSREHLAQFTQTQHVDLSM